MDTLDQALTLHDCRLLVIDPIVAFLDRGIQVFNDQSIRRALRPLADLAARHHCVALLIRHLNKLLGSRALYRGAGSIGLTGACRSVWLLDSDPDEPDRYVMAQVKNNLAPHQPSLTYRIHAHDGALPTLEWTGTSPLTAAEVLARGGSRLALPGPGEEAAVFLRAFLADGPRATADIWPAALEEGLNVRTVQRARDKLKIKFARAKTAGKTLTYWLLPGQKLADGLPPGSGHDDLSDLFAPLREKYPTTPLDEDE
jgi:hypothetical protein